MDFDFTDEQSLLKDSVARWAADRYGSLEQVEAARRKPLGFDGGAWSQLAELGLLGLPFSEEDGGFGGGPVETMIAVEALGRHLAPEPYLASVVLGGGALRLAGTAAQREALVPGLVEEAIASPSPMASVRPATTARTWRPRPAGRATASGSTGPRPWCSMPTRRRPSWSARARRAASGTRRASACSSCPPTPPGLTIKPYPTQDGGRAADLVLDDVILPANALLGEANAGLPVIERVLDEGIAALCAEAVGVMEALHALTVDYLKTRKQFGTAIGGFQVLQHRAVDMLMSLEQARSMALYATMMAGSDDAAERAPAVSAAKVQVNRAARYIGQEAVQLHGGIGMTLEYLGAHLFRRLATIEYLLGDTPYHLRRVSDAGGLLGAA